MANATPSRVGQINAAGSTTAMFLKIFGGEVLAAFAERNKFMDRTMVRNITHGITAQFPATGKATAAYHTPGAELVGQVINGAERNISIDDALIADAFIANVDEAKAHYEVRAEYSKQLGAALARACDRNIAQVGVLAARASATVTGLSGGSVVTSATSGTNADAMIQAIFDAVTALQQKDVPLEETYVYLKPAQYYLLVNSSSKLVNRDYSGSDNGGVADGNVLKVAGLPIVLTNNLPASTIATGPAAYQGVFDTVTALVMNRAAVGTTKLWDIGLESAYDIRRQGTLFVAKMLLGHGILRPECSVEIKSS